MDGDAPRPPEDLSGDARALLDGMDRHELRQAVVYAQELLAERGDHPLELEPLPGEEFVRVTERDGHTEVVKRQPCADGCDACPHGPYLYHVRRETHPEGGDHLHWTLIGRVRE